MKLDSGKTTCTLWAKSNDTPTVTNDTNEVVRCCSERTVGTVHVLCVGFSASLLLFRCCSGWLLNVADAVGIAARGQRGVALGLCASARVNPLTDLSRSYLICLSRRVAREQEREQRLWNCAGDARKVDTYTHYGHAAASVAKGGEKRGSWSYLLPADNSKGAPGRPWGTSLVRSLLPYCCLLLLLQV